MINTNELHGLLLVDKPSGITSHDVVAVARKALGQKSIGHTGTLDPLASGLMILVLGEATKLSDYLTAEDKSYEVLVQLGLVTDTLDVTGEVIRQTEAHCEPEAWQKAAEALVGSFEWPIPVFSAAKRDGKKLYELGREAKARGQTVEMGEDWPVKTMQFWDLKSIELLGSRARFQLHCSKGSFIRTWADQLGKKLEVGACLAELRRLSVGAWSVDQAVTLEDLKLKSLKRDREELIGHSAFIGWREILPNLRALVASGRDLHLLRNGQIPRDLETRLVVEQKQAAHTQQAVVVKVVTPHQELLALVAAEPGRGLKIRRVFKGLP